MMIETGLVAALSAVCIAVTLLPLLKMDYWLVRDFDFPRLQVATLLAGCAVLQSVFFSYVSVWAIGFTGATLAALVYQLCWIMPYSPFAQREVPGAQASTSDFTLRLLSISVLMTNRRADKIIELIKKQEPDIVITLETNDWWQKQLQPLEADYPHRLACPLDNLYGMHVYSKLELLHPQTKFLVEDDKPSMHAAIKLPDGQLARLHFVHPAPPSPTENDCSSERDAELLVLAEELKGCSEPVIVAGDLNDVAWSRTTRAFRRISGLLDPRIGRGTFNTFHTGYWFLRWPLDHLFHSGHFRLCELRRLENVGSDHFPLLSCLKYHPHSRVAASDKPDPNEERWAKQKIADEQVSPEQVPNPATPSH